MEIIEKSYFLIYVQYSKFLKFLQNDVLLLYDFMRKQIYPPNSPFKIDQQLTNHRGGGKDSLPKSQSCLPIGRSGISQNL